MKNILSILLVSVILFGCSGNRVLIDKLTNKGTQDSPIMHSEKGLFNGVGFNIYENGQIESEGDYKDGKRDGLFKQYYKDGFLEREGLYKNGIRVGKWNEWSVVTYGLDSMKNTHKWYGSVSNNNPRYVNLTNVTKKHLISKEVNFNNNGELDGALKFYEPFGLISEFYNFSSGKKHGKQILWYILNDTTKTIQGEAKYDNGDLIYYIDYDREGNEIDLNEMQPSDESWDIE